MRINFDSFPDKLKIIVRDLRNNKTVIEILEERLMNGGYKPFTEWQKEYLESLFDINKTFVQQGLVGYPGCGKSTTQAIAVAGLLIFCCLKPPVDIRVIGPTGQLTEAVLYKELKRILIALDVVDCFDVVADKLFIKGDTLNKFGAMHVVRIPNEQEREDSLRGGHSQGIFCQIFDECIKFPDWVFLNCAGNMNAGDTEKVIWLTSSNLTTSQGYFVNNIILARDSAWRIFMITIDHEVDPVRKKNILANSSRYYGKDTEMYRSMLYCKLPELTNNSVFNYTLITEARKRHELLAKSIGQPVVLGIDISSGISDAYSAYCIRNLVCVMDLYAEKSDIFGIVNQVKNLVIKYNVCAVIVDSSSDSAVFELLKNSINTTIIPFKGTASPSTKGEFNQYENARTEIFFRASAWLRGTVYFDMPDVMNNLIRNYSFSEGEQVVSVISKKEKHMRSIIRKAPIAADMVDAFTMTFDPRIPWTQQYNYHNIISNSKKIVKSGLLS